MNTDKYYKDSEKIKYPSLELKKKDPIEHARQVLAYKEAHEGIRQAFKDEALFDLKLEKHPHRDIIFQKAWERGHSAGYSEVWLELCDLKEFTERIQNAEPNEKVKDLLAWIPEGVDLKRHSRVNHSVAFEKKYGNAYSEGDEKCPFFSEAYLYNLLGKEDARTLLCLMERALDSLGQKLDL